MVEQIKCSIANGNKARFWFDVWVGKEPLVNLASCPICLNELNLTIDKFVMDTRN